MDADLHQHDTVVETGVGEIQRRQLVIAHAIKPCMSFQRRLGTHHSGSQPGKAVVIENNHTK